jgi:WD40 repeat protein
VKQPQKKMTTGTTALSPAEAIVYDAAVRIGLATANSALQNVCNRMKQELVKEEWQLQFIDSFQWEKMGAPIGLVAAIRNIISQKEKTTTQASNPDAKGDESNDLSSTNYKLSSDGIGIGESNAGAAPKKLKPLQPENDAKTVAFRSFPNNFFHRLAVKLVDKGVGEERLMALVDSLLPEIPQTILVQHVLPMIPDRKTFNNLRATSKEIHNTSKQLIENGKITPPWPRTSIQVPQANTSLTSMVYAVAFSPDGTLLAYGGSDGVVRIRNGPNGVCSELHRHSSEFRWQRHGLCINDLLFSPNGRILASACRTICLWTLADRSCIVLEGHGSGFTSIAFSTDGLFVASGCGDGSSHIWNISSGTCVRILSSIHISNVRSIAFSPSGGSFVSAGGLPRDDSDDDCYYDSDYERVDEREHVVAGRILLWDLSGENDVVVPAIIIPTVIDGHTDEVGAIAYSPDGRYLASGGDDCTVKVWNVAGGRCELIFEMGISKAVMSVCFSPNGKVLVAGSVRGSIQLWNVDARSGMSSRGSVDIPRHHGGNVSSISFSPNGRTIATTGGPDRTVRLWNPNEHKLEHWKKGVYWDELIRLWNLPT